MEYNTISVIGKQIIINKDITKECIDELIKVVTNECHLIIWSNKGIPAEIERFLNHIIVNKIKFKTTIYYRCSLAGFLIALMGYYVDTNNDIVVSFETDEFCDRKKLCEYICFCRGIKNNELISKFLEQGKWFDSDDLLKYNLVNSIIRQKPNNRKMDENEKPIGKKMKVI
jgi:hypothetical protein